MHRHCGVLAWNYPRVAVDGSDRPRYLAGNGVSHPIPAGTRRVGSTSVYHLEVPFDVPGRGSGGPELGSEERPACHPRRAETQLCTMLDERIPMYWRRHSARPGITGWAQVKYQYGSTIEETERKLEYDLYYIKNLSLKLDLAIILATFNVILFGRGAK